MTAGVVAEAGAEWEVVALPYVRVGEAALAAPVATLGVLLLVQGAGEAGPGGVGALGWGHWCSNAHQSRKQTWLLWCHGGYRGVRVGARVSTHGSYGNNTNTHTHTNTQ